jgi:DNA-binding XRE family transcriptional regulator
MKGRVRARRTWAVDPIRVTEFWMSVDRGAPDECWPWTGYTEDGYGRFLIDDRMIGAHELALSFSTGERRLPELDTCHSCNNPPCCNPAHLRFDTRQSNVDDMVRAGRQRTSARLSDDDVRMIRRRREAGANQDDLAEQFGVAASYISMIVNGKARAAAGGPIATDVARRYFRKKAA